MLDRYRHKAGYIPDFAEFRSRVLAKTVIPHQVEFQPGPKPGKLCWLTCPYCYGGSVTDSQERFALPRVLELVWELAHGGVQKIIFAGYATDPLHSPHIESLIDTAVQAGLSVGINTKALHISDRLLTLLTGRSIRPEGYLSVSVDAGSDEIYNRVHAVQNTTAKLYSRVWANVSRLTWHQGETRWGAGIRSLEVAATYLVSRQNADEREWQQFIRDFRFAGCDVLRFAFLQIPRHASAEASAMLPTLEERRQYRERLQQLADQYGDRGCRILVVDDDAAHGILDKARTVPCFARFVFPTIGFDGWLYPCSQSAAPAFRSLALGNLAERGFWACYYDYDPESLTEYLARSATAMEGTQCRCDRKAHLVNAQIGREGVLW